MGVLRGGLGGVKGCFFLGGAACTDGIQDPAHGAVPAAHQDPKIRHVPEEIEPEREEGG